MQKTLSFSAVEAAVHTWQDAVQHLLVSTRTAPHVFAFESFQMVLNVLKLWCDLLLIILQVHLEPDMSLHEVMF